MTSLLSARCAGPADAELLGEMNSRLIQDEGHRNAMTVPELQARTRDWLAGDDKAVLFEREYVTLAYALYREEPDSIYLRQFFVERAFRRQGWGRHAVEILRRDFWPANKRLTVDVLWANRDAISFWEKAGFCNYSLRMEFVAPPP